MADEDSSLRAGRRPLAPALPARALPLGLLAAFALASCKPDAPTEPTDRGFRVTLEWDAPTEDAMGAPLADLEGYRVHYRATSPANGPGAVVVDVGNVTQSTVADVPAGTWVFGVTARDVTGNESGLSNQLSVEVGP